MKKTIIAIVIVQAGFIGSIYDFREPEGTGVLVVPDGIQRSGQADRKDQQDHNGDNCFFHISFHLLRWFPEAGAYPQFHRSRC